MNKVRDAVNALVEADLNDAYAKQQHRQLQHLNFMGGATGVRQYGKGTRLMRFLRGLIEKALGVPELRLTLVDSAKLYKKLEDRVRELELAEVKRVVRPAWHARYRDPAREHTFDAFFGQAATITEVRANGLLIQGGGFVPWSWVADVTPPPEETAVQDAED